MCRRFDSDSCHHFKFDISNLQKKRKSYTSEEFEKNQTLRKCAGEFPLAIRKNAKNLKYKLQNTKKESELEIGNRNYK